MKKSIFFALLASAIVAISGCEKPSVPPTPEPKPDPDPVIPVDPPTPPVETLFSGGEGTEANPYVISKAADLLSMSEKIMSSSTRDAFIDKYYVQSADIDMSSEGNFTPIAQNPGKPFKGVYDGKNHSISGLSIKTTAERASGLFGYTLGATVKNIAILSADIDCSYIYCGCIVGQAKKSTIENISFSGKIRQYTKEISLDGDTNVGYSGGFVGYALESTIKGCTLNGTATFFGKYCGGIVGYAEDCVIEDCHVAKDMAVNLYYHWEGGIVGKAIGPKTAISKCSFEGSLSSVGYTLGGIVGQLQGGKVKDCVLGSYATIGSDKYAVGGIVGHAAAVDEISIENCAVYGNIKGCYSVGGIVGFTGSGASAIGGSVTGSTNSTLIKGCAVIGSEITGTGNNGGSNLYSLVGGISGWTAAGGSVTITGCYANPSVLQTTSGGNRGGLGGVTGYQNNTSSVSYKNIYTTISKSSTFNCNDPAESSSKFFLGAIYARATQPCTVANCYYDADYITGPQEGKASETACQALSVSQMTDGTLLSYLQASAEGVNWVKGADGYPTISGLPADPNVKPKAAKRVSVIGDSISTFKGWIPGGYSAHYPATDGSLTLVSETYWYRLIYDHMKNAQFDTNIAFSGSTVTNTTEQNYTNRYGSASNAWWHNSFTERFAACGGCGRPDIILIHGGTNDWAHNADPLYPGSELSKSASTPSDGVLDAIYKVADAAQTREEVNALPDGTFCEAYVKLLCQIRQRYPKCKVVCIIGDYLSEPFEQSMLKMAAHYGAKTVDLLAVNGFNDQTYMPKHDYNGTSGCHPGSQAMDYIATKIYNELGAWLEQ